MRSEMSPAHRNLKISSSVTKETTSRDEELLLAVRAGSHEAFAELQRTYSRPLYRRVLSITRNREDAEDALQDAFFCAYRGLSSFEQKAKFSSWMTRIAVNSALMIIRKRRARPETSFEQERSPGNDSPHFDVPDRALNPEQVCDQQQRSKAILLAIERLDPKLRIPFGMWISEEYSMKDLAQDLGISLASVKARLYRARRRLIRSPALRNH